MFIHNFVYVISAFERAKEAMDTGNYAEVITLCTQEINTPDSALVAEALLLRGTFYVLCAQGDKGLEDLDQLLKREGVLQRVQYCYELYIVVINS